MSILQHVKWTTVDKRSVIPDISLETLKVGNTSRLEQEVIIIEGAK